MGRGGGGGGSGGGGGGCFGMCPLLAKANDIGEENIVSFAVEIKSNFEASSLV